MTTLRHVIDGDRYICNVGFSLSKERLDNIIKKNKLSKRLDLCLIGSFYDEDVDSTLSYFICEQLGLNGQVAGLVSLYQNGMDNKLELSELVYFLEGYDILKKVQNILNNGNITSLGEYHIESSPGLWRHVGFSFDL